MSVALGIAAFAGGTWLLVESVEGLVRSVQAWAVAAGLSGVLVSALVLGFDIEATAAGVASTIDRLPGAALGTSVGAALFLLTAGLGIAGLVAPFQLRTPRPLLAATAVAAVVSTALMVDGHLTRLDGAALLVAFCPLLATIVRAARHARAPARAPSMPSALAVRIALGLAGIVVGAELLVYGTREVVAGLGVSETVFGLLVVAAAVSFEEIVLEALPAYRGFPELSVGNALGTVVFLLTASLGVIALARPLDVPASVTTLHIPALLVASGLALTLLARGRLGRPEGAVLLVAYAVYALTAVLAGG